ncbi:hypothetical protein K3172_13040 [Qipengyuania sp. 6B39]|uniref:hypothetical protein n=1 Tax=Qipengyuania proteolytica TaxID=2867239 RepID=UPI001C89999D|nr:hypothetical protein [Qipengyuania proteolytica]MBX7496785.1 hypothetical protein [Qipengyuania proteolytica]
MNRSAEEERADLLAYMKRRRANCVLVAAKSPEFADDAKVLTRQLDILIDEVGGGLHEGEAEVAATRAVACSEDYPFTGHRTMAEENP